MFKDITITSDDVCHSTLHVISCFNGKTFLLIVLSFDKQINWKLKYYLIHVFLMVEEKWFNNNAKIIILLIIILNLLINN